jgi:hypothetical protein
MRKQRELGNNCRSRMVLLQCLTAFVRVNVDDRLGSLVCPVRWPVDINASAR